MSRYIGPRCRLSRREQVDLEHTSGIKPLEEKCHLDRIPGQHWQRRGRPSDYGAQLRMKQCIRRYYNVQEKQFRRYYQKADRMKGSTGSNLLSLLESRLDNVVYRMGFASTRAEARQLVSHKAIKVNDSLVNIPSFHVSVGDVISIRDRSKKQLRIRAALDLSAQRGVMEWLDVDSKAMVGVFKDKADVSALPPFFKVNLVVELYSK